MRRRRTPPPYPPYVIRSCELSEMRNEEEDNSTLPYHTPNHQELRIKWESNEEEEEDTPPPPYPPVCH